MDQLPRLGKRELICLLSFTCNYVVFVWRGFLFLWVLGMGYVILLWHSLSLPYNYLAYISPYLEFQISLPKFKNFLLCLIILPIWKRKSPYLSSGMYHMSDDIKAKIWCCNIYTKHCTSNVANSARNSD